MIVLVTGATGFIGGHVAEALARRGEEVRCLARSEARPPWLAGVPLAWRRGSVEEPESLAAALAGVRQVYHLAGVTHPRHPDDFQRVNAEGTRALLAACRAACPRLERFVLVSSLSAVGPSPDGRPLDEDAPFRPVSAYGRSKAAAEAYARAAASELPITVIRPPAVYGPRERQILSVFRMIDRGLAVLGDRGKTLNLVNVLDLVDGCLAAAAAPAAAGRTYFIAHPETVALDDFMAEVARALGRRPLFVRLPDRVLLLAGGILEDVAALAGQVAPLNRDKAIEAAQRHWRCSPERARHDFGFAARRPLAEGVRATVEWYRRAGWL